MQGKDEDRSRVGEAEEGPWWKEGIVYQIYPRSFYDANGDGIGDLAGIIEKLDYLNDGTAGSLGIDAIWLSPIYPSPMYDFGYDISDYCAIDPVFGDMKTFDTLIEQAHKRGIRVILDMVFNHSSHLHPWFIESSSSRQSPKRDWYIWRDGRSEGRPPNNWLSAFGGSAWEWHEGTGQFYYHSFLKEQPDLNWWNPDLRGAVYDVMRFWLDRGVDGFRLDVVHFYVKDRLFRDNPRGMTGLTKGILPYDRYRHLYDRDRPEGHEIFKEMRTVTNEYPDRMMVGETPYEHGASTAVSYLGDGTDELHLAFYFKFLLARWRRRTYRARIDDLYRVIPEKGWPCWVLNNHDVPRSIDRLARPFEAEGRREARAKAAATILLTLKGTPFLYYGEELGMRNGSIPRSRLRDPLGKRYWPVYKGRDPARTPMQWGPREHAGFSTVEPWLPVNADYRRRNVECLAGDETSILEYYKMLIRLRREERALRRGDFEWADGSMSDCCLAYTRTYGSEGLLVVVNFSAVPQAVRIPRSAAWGGWRLLLSTHPRPRGIVLGAEDAHLRLEGFEALVLKGEGRP
jgi:alpha-glucosidase